MDNGWNTSAKAWIADMGEEGDFGRRYVLDPVMLPRAIARSPRTALDVGCGEGRFCRMLQRYGIEVTGLDPTSALIAAARVRDVHSTYVEGAAQSLPFADESFDLVVSYLSLIDIPNIRTAIPEMVRVLKPGGSFLIANLTSFNTAGDESGWVKDLLGRKLHFRIDRYLEERATWIDYRGIRVLNYHRPLSTYMSAFLGAGLRLTYFDEPSPSADAHPQKAVNFRRAPNFVVMEWRKPAAGEII